MNDLRAPHWVYRMFGVDDQLLYVGMTRTPARRMTDWRKVAKKAGGSHWFSGVRRVAWVRYGNKPLAMGAERRAIQSEHPIHNVKMVLAEAGAA